MRGARWLAVLSAVVFVVLYGLVSLNRSMEWMTVSVAPFFGLVVFFICCSLIYFWYCVLAKRLRSLGHRLSLLHGLLVLIFAAGAGYLVDYQDRTLDLQLSGITGLAGTFSLVCLFLAAGLFLYLVAIGMRRS